MLNLLVWSLPLVSGFADAASRFVIKLTTVRKFALVAAGYLFALPFYVPLLAAEGIPVVQPLFWLVLAVHVPLLIIAQVLTVEAHRASPLIVTAPYLALTSVFLLVTSPVMGGGTPNRWGALGVVVLTVGLYFLNTREGARELKEKGAIRDDREFDLLAPFRRLAVERGSQLMVGVAAIFAITANLDYLALTSANASFYLLVDHGIAGAICAVLAVIYWRKGLVPANETAPRDGWWWLPLYGLVIAASVVPHMLAFWWVPVVPYVIAGKRAGAIGFSVGMGIVVASIPSLGTRYVEERQNLGWRLIGVAFVILGMLIIIFWGKS